MTIKFVQIDDEGTLGFPGTRDEIVMTTHAVGMSEILEVFERFLSAMGFHYDGHLEFIDEFSEDIPPPEYDPKDVAFPTGFKP